MPVADVAQLGVADETTFGTVATPTRFYEMRSEGINEGFSSIESQSLRAGYDLAPSDSVKRYPSGAAGDFVFEVQSKGFAWWVKHMLGALAVDGTASDSLYTHVGTFGSLYGQSFTCQVNRPMNPSEADSPITFHGGKVARWGLECGTGQFLVATLGLDFEEADMTTALAAASYPTSKEFFSFLEGTVEIGDVAVVVDRITMTCDNGLIERPAALGSTKKREPSQGRRSLTWSIDADFESETQYDLFRSAELGGAIAKIELEFTGLATIGAASNPGIKVTLNDAVFDQARVNVGGPSPLKQALSGMCVQSSSAPIQIDVSTAEATP